MADAQDAQVESVAPEEHAAEPTPAPAAAEMADEQVESVAPEVRAAEPPPAAAAAEPAPAGGLKRKRAAEKTMSVEDVAAAIKKCHEEAEKAEAGIRELQATADAHRAQARKLSQEYERKQREAALAHLESSKKKRPSNPFFLFADDIRSTIEGTIGKGGPTKKIGELWANLSDEERKKYKDKFKATTQEYEAWTASEEGRKMNDERNEILRQCKAAKSELAEATAASKPSQQHAVAQADDATARRHRPGAGAAQVTSVATPEKHRKAKASPATEPVLDEKVLEAASQADLLTELRNLAVRPDVLALKKSSQELLDALAANGGLVNAARRSLLGA